MWVICVYCVYQYIVHSVWTSSGCLGSCSVAVNTVALHIHLQVSGWPRVSVSWANSLERSGRVLWKFRFNLKGARQTVFQTVHCVPRSPGCPTSSPALGSRSVFDCSHPDVSFYFMSTGFLCARAGSLQLPAPPCLASSPCRPLSLSPGNTGLIPRLLRLCPRWALVLLGAEPLPHRGPGDLWLACAPWGRQGTARTRWE